MLLSLIIAMLLAGSQPRAQADSSRAALGVSLRGLGTTATFMMATAHPDDENNAVLAMLTRGLGARAVLATATRGEGGQNEIGPELFEALSALRTEELRSAHRLDGAEQLFARAVDFGYSFSVEETFDKWGRDEILADYVRFVRMVRPDVMVAMSPTGTGGGQHHQASAQIAREAFDAAADPARFPDQIAGGLRPWQAKKFYFTRSWGFRGEPPPPDATLLALSTEIYDPLLGSTYAELGSEARSMHKCQGMSQLLLLPGQAGIPRYELVAAADRSLIGRAETSFFDGLDVSLEGLARYAPEARDALAGIAGHARGAQEAFDRGDDGGLVRALVAGLAAVRELRGAASSWPPDAAYEIDARLALKEDQFARAVVLAHGLRVETLANDGVVVAGQPVALNILVANRSALPARVRNVSVDGLRAGAVACSASAELRGLTTCSAGEAAVPAGAGLTNIHWRRASAAARYDLDPDVPFGAPFSPSPFRARIELDLSGAAVVLDRPFQYRYEGNIFSGEKRMELKVVPRLAVSIEPEVAILPLAATSRELRVTVRNGAKTPASGQVRLSLPAGWTSQPPSLPISLAREDGARTVTFTVSPPAGVTAGAHRVRAIASVEGTEFDRGFQVVEYPHTERRHLVHEASATIRTVHASVAPGLTVGYVMGVGDQVPPAIEQLGATVVMLGPDDLGSGNLSRFDAIVTGVRAYERRADLRAHNERLIEYARQGGTVIVQYNKFEFNHAQYGPYPANVSSNRVTDETSPVRILAPTHPVFNTPNPIGPDAWSGWVQERGLYFLGERDPLYVDLVELEDPFEYNAGPKRGALVEARVGKGRWIYLGLGLWRQLPAGTPGAYALLANLISLKP
jgi:LmbE family N-acetylglucosaminyl deacetylase